MKDNEGQLFHMDSDAVVTIDPLISYYIGLIERHRTNTAIV